MNITDKQAVFSKKVEKNLHNRGFKVKVDLRNEKVGFKIREHTLARVPFMLVIGDRELETESVAVRSRSGEDFGSMSIDAFADRLASAIENHDLTISEE